MIALILRDTTMIDPSKIEQFRLNKNWNQLQLAQKAKINPSVISRIERGLQKDCKLSVILAIASALDVRIDDLLTTRNETEYDVELEAAMQQLVKYPQAKQKQAAAILRGYLSSLEELS